MKKMVEIYSTGNEYYYFLDGKKRGGFSTKEKAKADAKEMNRARKAGGQKKFASAKMKNIRTGPIQQGETKLSDAKRERLKKSEWFDLLKKDPRRTKKARKKRKKGKKKSTVNQAGNYTKPAMRRRIFNRIKRGGKGGAPGQWSARKAQMLAQAYKRAGGGYRD